jgi:hypothetical protein
VCSSAVTGQIGKKTMLVIANPVLVVQGLARTGLLVTGEQYRCWVPEWKQTGASSSRFGKNRGASDWEAVALGTSVQ